MRDLILAYDTSNYTTSAALVDTEGVLVANLKIPLPVKEGERGLRQSEALFHHTVGLPQHAKDIRRLCEGGRIVAVGVSERPRNVEGSYMPCFLAGVSAAESTAAALGVPLYRFSHQCGHIMAALYSSGVWASPPSEFAAFHVSGGTTELLRVKTEGDSFSAELVGGTRDLNAGQVIDRIGVAMGMGFPAGAELERRALENTKKIPKRKISRTGTEINLSGLENIALSLYKESGDPSLASAFVFDYVGRALIEMSEAYTEKFGTGRFLFAGGVMSNSIIKKMISERVDALFAEPRLSADNAVGIAVLALKKYKKENP